MKVGYARVSSIDGSQESGLMTQIQILKDYGCEKIFSESQSGTSTDKREELKRCLDFVRESDHFVVTRLDRCSRSVLDLQLIVKELEDKGVTFAATEQSINTKTAEGKCFMNMLSVFSEFENNLRKSRQLAGIKRAKQEGKFKGRVAKIDAKQIKRLKDEGLGASEIARQMNIERTAVYRLLKKVEMK